MSTLMNPMMKFDEIPGDETNTTESPEKHGLANGFSHTSQAAASIVCIVI